MEFNDINHNTTSANNVSQIFSDIFRDENNRIITGVVCSEYQTYKNDKNKISFNIINTQHISGISDNITVVVDINDCSKNIIRLGNTLKIVGKIEAIGALLCCAAIELWEMHANCVELLREGL